MVIRSEFATVEVERDETGNGPRLVIRNLKSGTWIRLDALELEALTRLSHRDFAVLVDPSFEGLEGMGWINPEADGPRLGPEH